MNEEINASPNSEHTKRIKRSVNKIQNALNN